MNEIDYVENVDLAGVDHWEDVYSKHEQSRADWRPRDYLSLVLESFLLEEIRRSEASDLLEVGCGDSPWLAYLAKQASPNRVAGIDYSARGCQLARQRLAREGVEGQILEIDIFDADVSRTGQYDFVYSLGVVEHFADLQNVINTLLQFVRPGGTLLTEIPNLRGVFAAVSWLLHPTVRAKHRSYGKHHLIRAYRNAGMEDVRASLVGLTSLKTLAWGCQPRFPRLERLMMPIIKFAAEGCDWMLRPTKCYWGVPGLAPYLYVVGRKPAEAAGP